MTPLRWGVWTVVVAVGAVAEVIRDTVAQPSLSGAVHTTAWLQGGPHGSLARRIRRGSRTCHYKDHTLFTFVFVSQFFFSSGKERKRGLKGPHIHWLNDMPLTLVLIAATDTGGAGVCSGGSRAIQKAFSS